jgi:hypothetical protein
MPTPWQHMAIGDSMAAARAFPYERVLEAFSCAAIR